MTELGNYGKRLFTAIINLQKAAQNEKILISRSSMIFYRSTGIFQANINDRRVMNLVNSEASSDFSKLLSIQKNRPLLTSLEHLELPFILYPHSIIMRWLTWRGGEGEASRDLRIEKKERGREKWGEERWGGGGWKTDCSAHSKIKRVNDSYRNGFENMAITKKQIANCNMQKILHT